MNSSAFDGSSTEKFPNDRVLSGSCLIIGVSVLFLAGVIVTYVLSVSTGHIKFIWCFISYTGNFPVESCIFSAVLNLSSGVYFLIVILKFNQIHYVMKKSELSEKAYGRTKRLNLSALILGLIGSAGLSITGCFQQRNVHFMHMVGVVCCTCGTNAFLILQTYFCFTLTSDITKASLKIFRLVVVVLSSGTLAAGAGMVLYYFLRHPRWFGRVRATMGEHTNLFKTGTVLEWVLFFLTQLYIYSFYPDFKKIGLKKNEIIFLE